MSVFHCFPSDLVLNLSVAFIYKSFSTSQLVKKKKKQTKQNQTTNKKINKNSKCSGDPHSNRKK